MIITLVKADFSAKNIGTLSSFAVLTNILNATYSGPVSVEKDGAFTATITMHDGYVIPDNIIISMGGSTLTNAYSVSGNVITISIAAVTGVIVINMAGVAIEDAYVSVLPLVQGYIDNTSVNSSQSNRIRSNDLISGPFSIELNNGYLIRAIYQYSGTDVSVGGTAIVASSDQLASYEGGSVGMYYGVTLCKANSNDALAPTEDVIKNFAARKVVHFNDEEGYVDTTIPGTNVAYTLTNNAWVSSGIGSTYANRVCTTEKIRGKFTVTVNDGYAIRAIYAYASKDDNTASVAMTAETSENRTTFTTIDDNLYYGVTFTYAGTKSNDAISPTEDIIAEWKYV